MTRQDEIVTVSNARFLRIDMLFGSCQHSIPPSLLFSAEMIIFIWI